MSAVVVLSPMFQMRARVATTLDASEPSAFVPFAMHWAARSQRHRQITRRAQGDVDARGQGGTTALMLAAHEGNAGKIKELVVAGASINAQDDYGWTSLRYAVRQGAAEAVKELIAAGADMNLASESGRTPLMSAVSNELDDMAQLLVENGADITLTSEDGLTAYDLSFRGGATRSPAVRDLIKIEDVEDGNSRVDLG
mmetsp:Transcript_50941/g.131362  ORF Transcript_50941/g.131362 Transcript_50941/m.131362 type:complete len:198 (-) Transcript_50941:73-666(-)